MSPESEEITLPGGFKFKGAAARSFWTYSGWIACVCVLLFALYGPPQQILERQIKLENQVTALGTKVQGIEDILSGRVRTPRRTRRDDLAQK